MAGGIATLDLLSNNSIYERLEARSTQLFDGLSQIISKQGLPVQLQRVGSMFTILFCEFPVRNFEDSKQIDSKQFAAFFHTLLNDGINLPPSSVDAALVSAAHTEDDIERTISVCDRALKSVFV